MQLLEKTFKLKEHKTTVLTEVVGGITTFFAMAYIIFVNPNFLSQTGMDHTAVMLATCISAAIGSLLTAFLANVPFAQAPGMGLNAFFTYTICFGMGYTWQQGLAIVFISGLIFLAVTVSPLRSKIIASIPASLKAAISAGIGLFICLIGLLNAGIVTAGNNLLDLSNITTGAPLLALIGLLLTGVLMAWKVKGALFIGIILTTLIGIPMGQTNVSNISISFEGISMAPTFFKLSFSGLFANLAERLVPDKSADAEDAQLEDQLKELDPHLVVSPSLALDLTAKLVGNMSDLALHNYTGAVQQIYEFDPQRSKRIDQREHMLDRMTDASSQYVVAVSPHITLERDTKEQNFLLKAITAFERIGDLAVNITDNVYALRDMDKSFSPYAMEELRVVIDAVQKNLDYTVTAYKNDDMEAARQV